MAFVFSTNNRYQGYGSTNPGYTPDLAIFNFKTFLKSYGWTVPQSSDGITLNQDGNDVITSGKSGVAGGLGGQSSSNSSWFVLRNPSGSKEFLFCRGKDEVGQAWDYSQSVDHFLWCIGYSSLGFSYSTGIGGNPVSITNPPLAFDSVWFGSSEISSTFTKINSTWLNRITNSGNYWNTHYILENNYPHDFYFFSTYESTSSEKYSSEISIETCINNIQEDTDKCVLTFNTTYGGNQNSFANQTGSQYHSYYIRNQNRKTWFRKPQGITSRNDLISFVNTGSVGFQNAEVLFWNYTRYGSSNAYISFTAKNKTMQDIDNYDTMKPIIYTCDYIKGYSKFLSCIDTIRLHPVLTTLSKSSPKDHLYLGNGFVIPWNGGNINK